METCSCKLRTSLLSAFLGISLAGTAAGQAVAPPVPTIWQKLGITQGLTNLRNATINPNGNHPDWEKTPPLKSLADPANLDPKQPPAIQAAAKIKQQEDLAPQKIKAIKYLATVGCGCYQKTVTSAAHSWTASTIAARTSATRPPRPLLRWPAATAPAAAGPAATPKS